MYSYFVKFHNNGIKVNNKIIPVWGTIAVVVQVVSDILISVDVGVGIAVGVIFIIQTSDSLCWCCYY